MNFYNVLAPDGRILNFAPLSIGEAFTFRGAAEHWSIHAVYTQMEIDALPTNFVTPEAQKLTVGEVRAYKAPPGGHQPILPFSSPRFKIGDLVTVAGDFEVVLPVKEVSWEFGRDGGHSFWRVGLAGLSDNEMAFELADPWPLF